MTAIRMSNPPCSVDACDRPSRAKKGGLCGGHKKRAFYGEPLDTPLQGRGEHLDPSRATYRGMHKMVESRNGKASEHLCVGCLGQASEWAYDHEDDDQVYRPDGKAYSRSFDHYLPMCVPCHRRFDR